MAHRRWAATACWVGRRAGDRPLKHCPFRTPAAPGLGVLAPTITHSGASGGRGPRRDVAAHLRRGKKTTQKFANTLDFKHSRFIVGLTPVTICHLRVRRQDLAVPRVP